jgi:hypothetical protein
MRTSCGRNILLKALTAAVSVAVNDFGTQRQEGRWTYETDRQAD